MCGRFALYSTADEIKDTFDLKQLPLFSARYNIAPSQNILCLRNNHGEKEAALMHWGLIPFWAKNKTISRNLINARAESLPEKPAFRQAFKTHRSLVIMSGFYEWGQDSTPKTPYYFKHPDSSPLAIAALWDNWQDENGDTIQSCCMITTSANELMRPVHNRMPVILNHAQQEVWLNHDEFNQDALSALLAPCPDDVLMKYPVTPKMNNARYEGIDAINPITD